MRTIGRSLRLTRLRNTARLSTAFLETMMPVSTIMLPKAAVFLPAGVFGAGSSLEVFRRTLDARCLPRAWLPWRARDAKSTTLPYRIECK